MTVLIMVFKGLLSVILLFTSINAQYEGDNCIRNGVRGVCRNLLQCKPAMDDIKNRRSPQICSFSGTDPVVCCVDGAPPAPPPTTSRPPVATTPKRSTTTTEYVPTVADYQTAGDGDCPPVSPELTVKKTGQKSRDKCIEYQERFIYPCERSMALGAGKARGNNCHHSVDQLVIGGENAEPGEIPHMALLGFGDDQSSAQWLCGGTVISDRFVLTAGHCTVSREFGPVTYAKLGVLRRSAPTQQIYKIQDIIKHPAYKPPIKYNDIALLRTEKTIELSPSLVPACLHTIETNTDRAAASGWGLTVYNQGGSSAEILQKVTLNKFSDSECTKKFPSSRLMNKGFDSKTQTCYGDKTKSKDTCQGDSGGPLQIRNGDIKCMYTIVGVTSFGKACGLVGEPGMYSKVSNYVPWIESIVWP